MCDRTSHSCCGCKTGEYVFSEDDEYEGDWKKIADGVFAMQTPMPLPSWELDFSQLIPSDFFSDSAASLSIEFFDNAALTAAAYQVDLNLSVDVDPEPPNPSFPYKWSVTMTGDWGTESIGSVNTDSMSGPPASGLEAAQPPLFRMRPETFECSQGGESDRAWDFRPIFGDFRNQSWYAKVTLGGPIDLPDRVSYTGLAHPDTGSKSRCPHRGCLIIPGYHAQHWQFEAPLFTSYGGCGAAANFATLPQPNPGSIFEASYGRYQTADYEGDDYYIGQTSPSHDGAFAEGLGAGQRFTYTGFADAAKRFTTPLTETPPTSSGGSTHFSASVSVTDVGDGMVAVAATKTIAYAASARPGPDDGTPATFDLEWFADELEVELSDFAKSQFGYEYDGTPATLPATVNANHYANAVFDDSPGHNHFHLSGVPDGTMNRTLVLDNVQSIAAEQILGGFGVIEDQNGDTISGYSPRVVSTTYNWAWAFETIRFKPRIVPVWHGNNRPAITFGPEDHDREPGPLYIYVHSEFDVESSDETWNDGRVVRRHRVLAKTNRVNLENESLSVS